MADKKLKNIFVEGKITPEFVAESIGRHKDKTEIGAHDIFLGQVRGDQVDGKTVAAIEYTAYEAMANEKMHGIREDMFRKYPLICMHTYHSLGIVETGGISIFVFISAAHRKEAIQACEETVNRMKAELPVWGRELFKDDTYQWKKNR